MAKMVSNVLGVTLALSIGIMLASAGKEVLPYVSEILTANPQMIEDGV